MATWYQLAATVLAITLVTYVVVKVIDRFRRDHAHEVDDDRTGVKIGAAFAVYGVLLGFSVVAAQQTYTDAEYSLRSEMGATMAVLHIAKALPPQEGQPILDSLGNYLRAEIKNWSALSEEEGDSESLRDLRDVFTNVQALSGDRGTSAAQQQLFASLADVDAGRANRLMVVQDTTSVLIWVLLLGGAVLVIAMASLLNFESPRLRYLLLISMAVLIGVSLFTFWALSTPFSGPVPIDSEPLSRVLAHL